MRSGKMSEKRFTFYYERGNEVVFEDNGKRISDKQLVDLLNEQQEQLDLYKEAILTMLGLLADKGIIFSGVKDE